LEGVSLWPKSLLTRTENKDPLDQPMILEPMSMSKGTRPLEEPQRAWSFGIKLEDSAGSNRED
jgi:hypothetical protein